MMNTYKFLTLAFYFPLKPQMVQEIESYSQKFTKISKGKSGKHF